MSTGSDLLVIGHVTRDLIGGRERLGGAASYATRTAVDRGLFVDLVTSAPARFELLRPLAEHPRVRAAVSTSEKPTTFSLVYEGPARTLRLLAQANAIDVISSAAPVVYLAPVAGEIAPALVDSLKASCVVIGLQGWMRRADGDGMVVPIDPPRLRGIHAAVFSRHDHPHAEALAARIAREVAVVALTRGDRGATLYVEGTAHFIPAVPTEEIDPTGAGDVFGATLAIELGRGRAPVEAAHRAAEVAARAVSQKNVFN